ncbi:MAG: hypothetical protein K0R84_18 [Clostridia bacterium]|jgi:acyl carrier protein|nr:hypothetical protein [Clostridia bacterium]
MDIFNELKELIIQNCQIQMNPEEINEDMNLVDDLSYNSIALILLMIAIENKWGIDFEMGGVNMSLLADIRNLHNIVVDLIEKQAASA